MITMDTKQQILHYYRVDGLSLREIARKTKTDRKTVTRLISSFEDAIRSDPEAGIDDFLAQRPKYSKREYSAKVLKDDISKEIDKWLKENERRRNNGMRKQCLKNKDIHRNPGQECEFDWGEVKLFIRKQKTTLMMAVFCFPYSSMRRAYLFHRQDTLAFMESHRNFFQDVNGVPCTMVYDNMKVAVVFNEKEKKPTVALQRLSNFYNFQWRFCNARAGWEKGSVEHSVDYVRSRAFTSRVDFESISEAQEWLNMICDQINSEVSSNSINNKQAKIAEELANLKSYPGEIGCFEIAEYKADKESTICIKSNHYSVPEEMAGKRVVDLHWNTRKHFTRCLKVCKLFSINILREMVKNFSILLNMSGTTTYHMIWW